MFAVIIPVGPDARDLRRMGALVCELERHENPETMSLIVVDDAPAGRSFDIAWPHRTVIRTPLWSRRRPPDPFSAHVAGTVEALRHARGMEFAVKLDTDAAVIAPFADAVRGAFADPELGVVGSYDVMSTGATRDWTLWSQPLARAAAPLAISRRPRLKVSYRRPSQRRAIRQMRDAAFRVAPPGAHCLGGAYAVSRRFLDAARLDWRPWVGTQLGEDVVVGLLCSHAGLRMTSLTGRGQPFAVAWRGLPASPAELVAARHSIVHSVKRDEEAAEQRLRAELQG